MPVGNWTDLRTAWFFQALIESAKLDAGEENDYNLLSQGVTLPFNTAGGLRAVVASVEGTTFTEMQGPMNGTGGLKFRTPDTIDQQYFVQEVTLRLFDRCPWNRVIFAVYVESMADNSAIAGTARIRLNRRPPTAARTPVNIFQLLASGFTAPGWYGSSIDITGLATDKLTFIYEQRGGGDAVAGAQIEAGDAFVQLGNTIVSGV